MGRDITKDKYHNNREDTEKERRRKLEELQENIEKRKEEICRL